MVRFKDAAHRETIGASGREPVVFFNKKIIVVIIEKTKLSYLFLSNYCNVILLIMAVLV